MPSVTKTKVTTGYDTTLIALYFCLITIGWFSIYSSAYDSINAKMFYDLSTLYGKQLLWIGFSLIIVTVILLINKSVIKAYSYYFYAFLLVVLILVLPFGTSINGAQAWIKIGSFSIQPSEFMKIGLALILAKFFSERQPNLKKIKSLITVSVFIMIPVAVIMAQRDTGSALVYMSFMILFFREGLSKFFFIIGVVAVALFISTLYFNELYSGAFVLVVFVILFYIYRKNKKKLISISLIFALTIGYIFAVNIVYDKVFELHQKQRIDSILGKTSDPKGIDYNLNQSKIAIGSGSFFGKGYLRGTQTKFNFVPERSTDFIFCGIAEEWGFLGTTIIIALFLWMIIRIIYLSENNRDPFIKYYGYGIAGLLFFNFSINIGMTMGLLPIIGVPLPFISYGGSSLWTFTIMLFLFIKLNYNKNFESS